MLCSNVVVRNATWSPAYELHATTEAGIPAPSVSLHYRARVTQSTGEDWTDVELTLSTADMNLSNQTIPVLSSTKNRPPKSLFSVQARTCRPNSMHQSYLVSSTPRTPTRVRLDKSNAAAQSTSSRQPGDGQAIPGADFAVKNILRRRGQRTWKRSHPAPLFECQCQG
jgi:Domain of unknown function (DUF4139)